MANVIRIKRSTGSSAPTTLANAELAFAEGAASGAGVLYYGTGTGGAGGSATSIIAIGGAGAYVALTGDQTISGTKTVTGTLALGSATLSGNATFSNNVTVNGSLSVLGTTTTVDSQTVNVLDKNITLGNVETPTDTTADGGGVSLLGASTKTFNWVNATDAWTSSEHIDLASGKSYYINGAQVLSGSALGSGVTGSSLTSVGTLTGGTWQANTVGAAYGGTGIAGGYANGELLIGNASGGLTKATLTAGTGVSITNGNGSITINAQETQSAGDGLDLTAGVFSVDLKANGGLVIESTKLAVDLGASSITGTLAVGDGGTGATTLTGLVKGNGTSAFTAAVAGTDYLSPSSEIDGGTYS